MTLCSSATSTRLLRWEACLPCSLPYEIRAPSVPCVGLLLLELNCQSIMPIVWEGITQLTVQGPSGGAKLRGTPECLSLFLLCDCTVLHTLACLQCCADVQMV